MTSSAERPNVSLAEQIGGRFPQGATGWRLIHKSGSPVVPDLEKSPFTRSFILQPPGLAEGEYYVEFYDDAGRIVPEPPGEPVVVSFWRQKPTVPAPTASPVAPAVAPSAPVAASAPAPSAPAPAAAPQDDWSANPDKWAHKLQVRQDHQMRDLGVAVFQQGIEQLKEIRDLYATMGQEQYKHQRLALDYGKEVFDLQRKLLEERREELAQRPQAKEDPDASRAKVDYTQLGTALMGSLQVIITTMMTRNSEHRGADSREALERAPRGERESASGPRSPQKVMLVPEEQADQALDALLKYSNPFELQKLLGDPAEQKKFADRIGAITGSATAPNGQIVRKS